MEYYNLKFCLEGDQVLFSKLHSRFTFNSLLQQRWQLQRRCWVLSSGHWLRWQHSMFARQNLLLGNSYKFKLISELFCFYFWLCCKILIKKSTVSTDGVTVVKSCATSCLINSTTDCCTSPSCNTDSGACYVGSGSIANVTNCTAGQLYCQVEPKQPRAYLKTIQARNNRWNFLG